jgi:arabinofuranan 3-O-arabinosyltransferase
VTEPGPAPAAITRGPDASDPGIPGPRPGAVADRPRPAAGIPDRWWFLIAWVAALTVFMAADRGQITFDTKLGVDIDASDFFARLWPLWDPLEWFGTLQNQYIGYAIPMAPFFMVGQLMHVPVWIIERLC